MAKLIEPQFKEADYVRRIWCASPEKGVTADDMQAPAFWAHVAKKLRPGDRIEALDAEGKWFAEFFVRGASATGAIIVPMRVVFLDGAAPPVGSADEFEVKYRGNAKWSVVRLADKAVMTDGLDTREQADDWLAKHLAGG